MRVNTYNRKTETHKIFYERLLTEKDARIAELVAALEHERELSKQYADAYIKSQVTLALNTSASSAPATRELPEKNDASFPMGLTTVSNTIGGVLATVLISVLAVVYSVVVKQLSTIAAVAGYIFLISCTLLFIWWNYKLYIVSKSGGTVSVPVMAVNRGLNALLRLGISVWYIYLVVFSKPHIWINTFLVAINKHHWGTIALHLFQVLPIFWFAYEGMKDLKEFIKMLRSPADARVYFEGYVPKENEVIL